MNHIMRPITRIILAFLLLPILITTQPGLAQGPIPGQTGLPSTGAPDSAVILPDGPAAVSKAFSGGPSYDSGWINLAKGETRLLNHNINGTESTYVVDMQYRNSGGDGTNQRFYGGTDFGNMPPAGHTENDRVGAYWRSLTSNTIVVYRRPEDSYAEQVRIRIWIDNCPNPECYDSGWQVLAPNETKTITHNMGGSADDLVIDMEFRNETSGINQRYLGGSDFGANIEIGNPDDRVGAYWRTLTSTTVIIYRRNEDTYAAEIRLRVWKRPRPTYDSGWVTINPNQAIVLAHNIGGQAEDYLVNLEFRSADSNGINNRSYGGRDIGTRPSTGLGENDRVGAAWSNLTANTIVIYRQPDDPYAPEMRVRIFNIWQVTAPNYDSGWQAIQPNESLVLTHGLGGLANSYMVDLLFRGGSVDGINQRYYGGSDLGASPVSGHAANDRVGAYWHKLSSTSITVYRQPEDTYAQQVRVRIWIMPAADYNSGWMVIPPSDTATVLNHNLGGNADTDYLVYFDQYNNTDKYNQRFYGGVDFGSKSFDGYADNLRSGAFWHQLTNQAISITRRLDDVYAVQLRLRIWRIRQADYNTSWVNIAKDVAVSLLHNLGNSEHNYYMQVQQWDTYSGNTLNQRYYGGIDFGSSPPTGLPDVYHENDRAGSYWRSLTTSSVTIYRRPEDGFADFMQVRIWDYSQKLYLPTVNR